MPRVDLAGGIELAAIVNGLPFPVAIPNRHVAGSIFMLTGLRDTHAELPRKSPFASSVIHRISPPWPNGDWLYVGPNG